MTLFYEFLVCFLATFFFAVLFRIPSKLIIMASVLGGLGYVVFDLCGEAMSVVMGYFFGTLFISLCSEILARLYKTPAVVFITPAVIPLVPGVALFHTVRFFVDGDISQGITGSFETMSYIGVMAVAIALPAMLIKVFVLKTKQ